MNINLFDVVFAIILVAFTLLSYLRGAVQELLGLIGLAAGFYAAIRYAADLAERLRPLLPDDNAAELLSFVLIMMMGYFAGVFLSGFSDRMHRAPASSVSRVLGALIGLAKGATVSLALHWVIQIYIPAFQDEMAQSRIGGWLAGMLGYLDRIDLI